MPELTDIADMPGFNPNGPQNGVRSVSEGRVSMKYRKLYTPCCKDHGALLCVAVVAEGRLYRCITCNEGAFRPHA